MFQVVGWSKMWLVYSEIDQEYCSDPSASVKSVWSPQTPFDEENDLWSDRRGFSIWILEATFWDPLGSHFDDAFLLSCLGLGSFYKEFCGIPWGNHSFGWPCCVYRLPTWCKSQLSFCFCCRTRHSYNHGWDAGVELSGGTKTWYIIKNRRNPYNY